MPTSTEHRCRGFVTDHDAPRSTPLDEVMRAFDVRSTDVVRVAGRIAREEGLGSISRGHFFRLRKGRMKAREDKILILVKAFQEITGVANRAPDLCNARSCDSLSISRDSSLIGKREYIYR